MFAEDEEGYAQVSSEEQRAEVVNLCDATEEWLYDEGRGQVASVYKLVITSTS